MQEMGAETLRHIVDKGNKGTREVGVNSWSEFWLFHLGTYSLVATRTKYPHKGLVLIFPAVFVIYIFFGRGRWFVTFSCDLGNQYILLLSCFMW